MSNKTAIQIAIESYKNDGVSFTDWFIDNYQMLLEMEKEQIIDAFNESRLTNPMLGFKHVTFEEYYNETYEQ